FRRRPVDGAGSHRPRCSGASHHSLAAHAPALAAIGVIRREGDRRLAPRVRRSRGALGVSTPLVAPAKLAHEHVAEPSMRKAARCAMVILGAGGDLTRRKLMPALAHLACDGLLDPESIILGVGRDNYTDDSYRSAMGEALKPSDEIKVTDGPALDKFLGMLRFVRGDLKSSDTYKSVTQRVSEFEGEDDSEAGRLIYLAIPPSLYPDAAKRVSESGLVPRT